MHGWMGGLWIGGWMYLQGSRADSLKKSTGIPTWETELKLKKKKKKSEWWRFYFTSHRLKRTPLSAISLLIHADIFCLQPHTMTWCPQRNYNRLEKQSYWLSDLLRWRLSSLYLKSWSLDRCTLIFTKAQGLFWRTSWGGGRMFPRGYPCKETPINSESSWKEPWEMFR